jgi:hypothetical protein
MGQLDCKQLEQLMLTQLVKKFLAQMELENSHLSIYLPTILCFHFLFVYSLFLLLRFSSFHFVGDPL